MAEFPGSLPPGWSVKYDPDGKMYYENALTGQTSWTRPRQNSWTQPFPSSPTFPQSTPARQPSFKSMFWSTMKQEFKAGFVEGFVNATRAPSQPSPIFQPFGTPSLAQQRGGIQFPGTGVADQVYINDRPLDKVTLLKLKLQGYQPPPNSYWYDKVCGAWGIYGGPCLGIIEAGMDFGGELQPHASSPTTTTVYINGRRIHTLDWFQLLAIGIVGTPGFYWLDASGRYGIQFSVLPIGVLVLQAMAVTSQVGADAFRKRELDPVTLLLLRHELEQAIAAANPYASPFSQNNPFSSTPKNPTDWKQFNDLFGDLGLGNDKAHEEEERRRRDDQAEERKRNEQKERERLERVRKEQQERERAERLRREQQEREENERLRREQQERERNERLRREQQERERNERLRREQQERERRERLRREAWRRYTRGWEEIQNGTARRSRRNPYDLMPWPTVSGSHGDLTRESAEQFFREGLSIIGPSNVKSLLLLGHLRLERARWHPDRMRRYFPTREIDTETIEAVTAVSQIINGLLDDEAAKP